MAVSFLLLLLLLVLVVLFMAVTVALIPKIMVYSAPHDIRDKVRARPDGPKWKTALGILAALLLLAAAGGILIWAGIDAVQNQLGFRQIFLRYLILLEGYKLFDMVCFDYILLTKLHIFQHFFPETIGCAGYQKYGFNLKSQLTKVAVFAVISFLVALILSRI